MTSENAAFSKKAFSTSPQQLLSLILSIAFYSFDHNVFVLEIISSLEKSCKNSTKAIHIPFMQMYLITFYFIYLIICACKCVLFFYPFLSTSLIHTCTHIITIIGIISGPVMWHAGSLVPQPGVKPMPSTVEAWNLILWTAREVPGTIFWE